MNGKTNKMGESKNVKIKNIFCPIDSSVTRNEEKVPKKTKKHMSI